MYYAIKTQETEHLTDFFEYLKYKGYKFEDFVKLSPPKKEEVFYRWKWGSTEHGANVECEMTRRGNPTEQSIPFERHCYEIKKKIGLVKEVPAELKRIGNLVGGVVKGWQDVEDGEFK